MITATSISPKDLLYPKQRAFIDDTAQYKIAVTTRQWGKSTVTSGEAVHDCLVDPGTKWVCMSAGERQSVEWLSKAKEWQAAYKMVITDIAEDRGGIAEGLLKSAEIQFANGSRIIAIPANPSTARGYSANVILDEFAYHEDPDAIWAAMFPATTNQLAGTFLARFNALIKGEDTNIRRSMKLRVVSTFNGRNNKFFQLWERAKENGYSAHKVTIWDAIADGMPLDAEKLRAALDDPDAWAQEYECEPMDASSVLLPYDLIATCESTEATTTVPADFWAVAHARPLFMGIDFARKRDLSVAWTDELMGDVLQSREVLEMKAMSTPDQIDLLRPRIQAARRVCLDYTGPGIGMGDYLVKEFGEWGPVDHRGGKIELCNFSAPFKVDIFTKLRMSFEKRLDRIPISRVIREDFHSMQRVVTANGSVSYRAPHTEDGHSDRITAKALCRRAATSGGCLIRFHARAPVHVRPHETEVPLMTFAPSASQNFACMMNALGFVEIDSQDRAVTVWQGHELELEFPISVSHQPRVNGAAVVAAAVQQARCNAVADHQQHLRRALGFDLAGHGFVSRFAGDSTRAKNPASAVLTPESPESAPEPLQSPAIHNSGAAPDPDLTLGHSPTPPPTPSRSDSIPATPPSPATR